MMPAIRTGITRKERPGERRTGIRTSQTTGMHSRDQASVWRKIRMEVMITSRATEKPSARAPSPGDSFREVHMDHSVKPKPTTVEYRERRMERNKAGRLMFPVSGAGTSRPARVETPVVISRYTKVTTQKEGREPRMASLACLFSSLRSISIKTLRSYCHSWGRAPLPAGANLRSGPSALLAAAQTPLYSHLSMICRS